MASKVYLDLDKCKHKDKIRVTNNLKGIKITKCLTCKEILKTVVIKEE